MDWAVQTKKTIVAALREASDGLAFARVVETVLARDKNWVRWKEGNCPEISREAINPMIILEATKQAKANCTWKRLRPAPIGSLDLKFLTDYAADSGLEKLAEPWRTSLPKAETLIEKVANVELDLEMATPDEVPTLRESKASKTWKTLRLTTRTNLSGFDKVQDTKDLQLLISGGSMTGPKDERTQDSEGTESDANNASTEMTSGGTMEIGP